MNAVVKEWIAKAEEDWRVANREFQITNEPAYAIVCYHSQQCAEKYMKALLISHNIRPEYTHDLIKLSLNITEIIIDWVFDKDKLYFLNNGGTHYWYPGETAYFEDAEYCFEICNEIKNKIAMLLSN